MKIGLFGIGKMGFPIACNLSADGHEVIVYDVFEPAKEKLAGTALQWGKSPREVMKASEVVFFVGLECNQLKAMLDGEDGVLAGVIPGTQTIIDLSTSDPADSAPLGEYLEEQKLEYLDCGMTGGVVGAKTRNLVFMAGGKREVYDRYLPVLEKLSKSCTFIGGHGCGHRMKLLHNAVSNSTFNVVIEACVLGRMYGMDLQAMIDVMNVGNARSYATEVRFPKYIIPETFDQGYTFKTGCKDFRMILKTAAAKNFRMPMAENTFDYWTYASGLGLGEEDITTLYNLMEKKNTVSAEEKAAVG